MLHSTHDLEKRICRLEHEVWEIHQAEENLIFSVSCMRVEIAAIIRYLRHNHPQTTFHVVNRFSGAFMANSLVLNIGQTSTDILTPFLADGVTPSGGTVSNVAVQFTDPSATAVLQPDGTVLFTAVAAGSASGSTSCQVTDTDGAVSQWTVPFTVTVNAPPPPEQLTQSVANVFSTPA